MSWVAGLMLRGLHSGSLVFSAVASRSSLVTTAWTLAGRAVEVATPVLARAWQTWTSRFVRLSGQQSSAGVRLRPGMSVPPSAVACAGMREHRASLARLRAGTVLDEGTFWMRLVGSSTLVTWSQTEGSRCGSRMRFVYVRETGE